MHTQTAHSFDNAWKTAGMDTHAPLKWEDKDNPSVVLRGFTVKQGGLLLREYLRAKVSRLPQAPSEVYPFTESALDAIAQATAERDQSPGDSTIAPRGLMDTAYHIFAAALSRQVQGPLGPDFVAHVFNGTPLPVPPGADDEMEEADSEEPRPSVACPCGCHEDSPGAVFDVMAVLSGSGSARRAVRHYCQNCNETITVEAVGG